MSKITERDKKFFEIITILNKRRLQGGGGMSELWQVRLILLGLAILVVAVGCVCIFLLDK